MEWVLLPSNIDDQSIKTDPRISVTAEDVASVGRIRIHFYKAHNDKAPTLTYDKLYLPIYEDPISMLDLL